MFIVGTIIYGSSIFTRRDPQFHIKATQQPVSTVTQFSFLSSMKYSPMISFRPITHLTVTFSCLLWVMDVHMWINLIPITHILLDDVPTQVTNELQTRIVFVLWLICRQKARRSALLSSVCLCKIWIL